MGHPDKNLNIWLAHRTRFVDYATTIVGNRAQGEDVVQEAFIRMQAAPAERQMDEPVGYLRRIVRNLAIDWQRRASSEKKLLNAEVDLEALADVQPSQEEVMEHQRQLRIMMDAMAELPPRTRAALEMHRFEGCKLKEIASQLGISVTLAHSLVYEGLLHCRRRLTEKA